MSELPRRRLTPLIVITVGFFALGTIIFLLFRAGLQKDTDAIILSFHQEHGDSIAAVSVPSMVLSSSATVASFTILIPHTQLLQTRYAISLLIPPADHASIPGLLLSNKSSGDAPDTLRLAIDRSNFTKTAGRYLLILNEILLEDSKGKPAAILFYPFTVSVQK
jgi:hypothetical protein